MNTLKNVQYDMIEYNTIHDAFNSHIQFYQNLQFRNFVEHIFLKTKIISI